MPKALLVFSLLLLSLLPHLCDSIACTQANENKKCDALVLNRKVHRKRLRQKDNGVCVNGLCRNTASKDFGCVARLPFPADKIYEGYLPTDLAELKGHSVQKRENLKAILKQILTVVHGHLEKLFLQQSSAPLQFGAAAKALAHQIQVLDLFSGGGAHSPDREVADLTLQLGGSPTVKGSTIAMMEACCLAGVQCDVFASDVKRKIIILDHVAEYANRFLRVKSRVRHRDPKVIKNTENQALLLVQEQTAENKKAPPSFIFLNVDPYKFKMLPLTLAVAIKDLCATAKMGCAMVLNYFAASMRGKESLGSFDFSPYLGMQHPPKLSLASVRLTGEAAFLKAAGMQRVHKAHFGIYRRTRTGGHSEIASVTFSLSQRIEGLMNLKPGDSTYNYVEGG